MQLLTGWYSVRSVGDWLGDVAAWLLVAGYDTDSIPVLQVRPLNPSEEQVSCCHVIVLAERGNVTKFIEAFRHHGDRNVDNGLMHMMLIKTRYAIFA